ncbi:MAG TPA: ABC transporter ATP-binding protein [Acidobacteriota bacterium]|nr:ABC transporter ATP-binding protein [Acidobacteriota bacterium]
MIVEVQDLKRYFGDIKAVDGVSFSFSSGRIAAFVGPNGAGKTTTMRILATLDEPTGGDVLIDGVSVLEDPEVTRRAVGFVPDALPSHSDISVHDYLDFFARAFDFRGSDRRRVVDEIAHFTGLGKLPQRKISALSKGMKQRLSVARALIHDPPVLVLDEPASGLDPRARVELRELLKVLAEKGKAILFSSHILSELSEICDDAVIIEQGRLLRSGAVDLEAEEDQLASQVYLRVLERSEELLESLLQTARVEQAVPAGRGIEVVLEGGQEECAQLLAQLVSQGWRIVEFRHRKTDLEKVFMDITRGEVQ